MGVVCCQTFHPPSTLRDFYRYIRIDFHSHYGNEFYCPLSLLRVYGLTHLEEWQWETWEEEARARRALEEASAPVEVVAEPPQPVPAPVVDSVQDEDEKGSPPPSPGSDTSPPSGDSDVPIPVTTDLLKSLQYNVTTSLAADASHAGTDIQSTPSKIGSSEGSAHDSARSRSDHLYTTHVSLSPGPSHVPSTASDNASLSVSSPPTSLSVFIDASHPDPHTSGPPSPLSSPSSLSTSSARPSAASASSVSALSVPTLSPSFSAPSIPVSTGGESIYRTIMNRLTALEANTTLYARYVEEQTAGMREVLRRLTEDLGRLEGIVSGPLWRAVR